METLNRLERWTAAATAVAVWPQSGVVIFDLIGMLALYMLLVATLMMFKFWRRNLW